MLENEPKTGYRHPISLTIESAEAIFGSLGYQTVSGPELETEFYNFDALNIPANHPARDMWDTFWLKQKNEIGERQLLRTHTSPVQVRYMQTHQPPFSIIVPGKVYRYEATDATHEAQFYQLEGLCVGEKISMKDLLSTIKSFLSDFFQTEAKLRIRPSYFPFVEPGVEIDMACFLKHESDKPCPVCKNTGFIELMGAGMVHPFVLNAAGISPKKFQGFAFGVGIDRLAMLRYGVSDVRAFYQGDLRLLQKF